VQVDGALAGLGWRRLQQRDHGDDTLRGAGLADLLHLARTHDLPGQLAGPVRALRGDVHRAGAEPLIARGSSFQFLHQVLAVEQEEAQLLAMLALVQLPDVLDLHARLRATASATLMPSTAAERMPPA
jgi:hypothetical protein